MVKKQQPAWQFKLSFALSVFMLFLIFGYFYQSFLEIRKVKPVSVAIERIKESSIRPAINSESVFGLGVGKKSTSEY